MTDVHESLYLDISEGNAHSSAMEMVASKKRTPRLQLSISIPADSRRKIPVRTSPDLLRAGDLLDQLPHQRQQRQRDSLDKLHPELQKLLEAHATSTSSENTHRRPDEQADQSLPSRPRQPEESLAGRYPRGGGGGGLSARCTNRTTHDNNRLVKNRCIRGDCPLPVTAQCIAPPAAERPLLL